MDLSDQAEWRLPPVAPIVVVMGVSGCGKTSVGLALAAAIGRPFLEGDALHSDRSIALMASGKPLRDEDRQDWLIAIAARIAAARRAAGLVVACSALKRRYRDVLRGGNAETLFVHLTGSPVLMRQRMARRRGHFMPASLVDSQFEALEPPLSDELALTVPAELPIEDIVALAAAPFARRRPSHN